MNAPIAEPMTNHRWIIPILPQSLPLVREDCDRAVLVCSTGIGISIAANKVRGVRCALCHDLLSAHLTRDHNDTNVLAMGSFIVGEKLAAAIVDEWLKTPFSNQGRHSKRISKIHEIEDRYLK